MPSFYEGFGIVLFDCQADISDTIPKEANIGINLVDSLSVNDDIQI